MELLRDELGKSSIWVFGIDSSADAGSNPRPSQAQLRERNLNNALALSEIGAYASVYVPLGLPEIFPEGLSLNRSSLWHTAGLLSAAVETALLPTRLNSTRGSRSPLLQEWEDVLVDGGRRKVARLSFGVEREVEESKESVWDARMKSTSSLLIEKKGKMGEGSDGNQMMDLAPEAPARTSSRRSRGVPSSKEHKTYARIESHRAASSPHATQQIERRRNPDDAIMEM